MADHRTEWVWVTPEIATRWLDTKAPNRVLNENLAIEYGIDMEKGRWQSNHQGIAFDNRGRLVDGQHRLHAISMLKNGFRLRLLVTHGLTEAEVLTLDRGRIRDAADSITIFRGTKVDKFTVAVANRMIHISPYYARVAGKTPGASWRVGVAELDKFLRAHEPAILMATSMRKRTSKLGLTSALIGSLVARAYYHLPEARMRQLLDTLTTGHYDDQGKDSGGLILRDHILARTEGFRGTSLMDHYRMERAIKAFWKGERITKIHPATSELFPLPEEKSEEPIVPAVIRRLEAARAAKGAAAGTAAQAKARAAAQEARA